MGQKNSEEKTPWWQPGMVLFIKLSGWIAGPIIVALFVGRWLDRKYHTEPWLFLLTVGVAFVVSMFGIVRDALVELKRIDKEEKPARNASHSDAGGEEQSKKKDNKNVGSPKQPN